MSDNDDRLDRLDAQLEEYRERLADHERALEAARETHADTSSRRAGSVAAGGLLAVLGLTAATGTASADPTGQIGTADRPVETVHTAALDGPLTDGQELDSLVGDGLAIEDGTLTINGGN